MQATGRLSPREAPRPEDLEPAAAILRRGQRQGEFRRMNVDGMAAFLLALRNSIIDALRRRS